jgi:hypothetical protein
MQVAAGSEDAAEFGGDTAGVVHMFQDGIALHALEHGAGERQVLGVGNDIDARHGEEVQIEVAGDRAAGAADVEVPAARGKPEGSRGFMTNGAGGSRAQTEPPDSVAGARKSAPLTWPAAGLAASRGA